MQSLISSFRHATSMSISSNELNRLQSDLSYTGTRRDQAVEKINSNKFGRRIGKTNNTEKQNTIRTLSREANTHNVPMGKRYVATDTKTILRTEGLTYCTGIGLLDKFDQNNGYYQNRSLMHLIGGSIDNTGLILADPNPASLINEFLERSTTENPGKAILTFGEANSSDYMRAMLLRQDLNGAQPLISLLSASDIDCQIVTSPQVSIEPDGTISISSIPQARILNEREVINLKKLATDDDPTYKSIYPKVG